MNKNHLNNDLNIQFKDDLNHNNDFQKENIEMNIGIKKKENKNE